MQEVPFIVGHVDEVFCISLEAVDLDFAIWPLEGPPGNPVSSQSERSPIFERFFFSSCRARRINFPRSSRGVWSIIIQPRRKKQRQKNKAPFIDCLQKWKWCCSKVKIGRVGIRDVTGTSMTREDVTEIH